MHCVDGVSKHCVECDGLIEDNEFITWHGRYSFHVNCALYLANGLLQDVVRYYKGDTRWVTADGVKTSARNMKTIGK